MSNRLAVEGLSEGLVSKPIPKEERMEGSVCFITGKERAAWDSHVTALSCRRGIFVILED